MGLQKHIPSFQKRTLQDYNSETTILVKQMLVIGIDCEANPELLVFPKVTRIYNKCKAWCKFLDKGGQNCEIQEPPQKDKSGMRQNLGTQNSLLKYKRP